MPLVAIKRPTKLYRTRGAAGFFAPQPRRESLKLTAAKLEQAHAWLALGEPIARVGAGEVRETLARSDDARALLRRLFLTPVNLRPDYTAHTLTAELRRSASPLRDAAVLQLCETLTATETRFPTTDLRLVYPKRVQPDSSRGSGGLRLGCRSELARDSGCGIGRRSELARDSGCKPSRASSLLQGRRATA